jgi:hypothetical protein
MFNHSCFSGAGNVPNLIVDKKDDSSDDEDTFLTKQAEEDVAPFALSGDTPWTVFFTGFETPYLGYVTTAQQLEQLIQAFEKESSSHFVKMSGKAVTFSSGKLLQLIKSKLTTVECLTNDTCSKFS